MEVKSSKTGIALDSVVGNRTILDPSLDAASAAAIAADPEHNPDVEPTSVAKARDLLQSLKSDPTLRKVAAGVPQGHLDVRLWLAQMEK